MVADTYTSRIGLLVQGTGNNNNSWGDTFNNSFGVIVERAIAGFVVHTDTGGTLDLSGSPPPAGPSGALDYVQRFTGALVSNLTVQMPNVQKTWMIDNSTSGNFSLFIRNGAAGGVVQVPQGCMRIVMCDGAGNMKREDVDDVGTLRMSGRTAAGAGELPCDGASKLRTDFPDLFSKIGTTWGSVDGTHFTMPLFTDTNRYLRAAGGAVTVGTYQSSQNKAHTHTGSGTTASGGVDHTHSYSGTTAVESQTHTHTDTAPNGPVGLQGGGTYPAANIGGGALTGTTGIQSANHTHTYSGTTGGASAFSHTHTYSFTTSGGSADGSEARPESAVVLMTILY